MADIRELSLEAGRTLPTQVAGLFLFVPLLLDSHFSHAVQAAGYPSTPPLDIPFRGQKSDRENHWVPKQHRGPQPRLCSQSESANNSAVIVPKVRVSLCQPPYSSEALQRAQRRQSAVPAGIRVRLLDQAQSTSYKTDLCASRASQRCTIFSSIFIGGGECYS
jgi:hypothetical protein